EADERARDRADRGGHFEEHRQAQVRQMVPDVDGCRARRGRDHADQARGDGDLDVHGEGQGHEGDEEHASTDAEIGSPEASEERRDHQDQEDGDRHAASTRHDAINFFPRIRVHLDKTISMLLTFVPAPSSEATFSVEMRTSRTSASGMKRPRTISATSTAREIERPRAFTMTSREPALKCVTTART